MRGGLHALIFVSLADPTVLRVAFRHQEGTTLETNDQWEAMGLWGRDFVQTQAGFAAAPGSILSGLSTVLQHRIHGVRRFSGRDYFEQSQRIVNAVLEAHPNVETVGFVGYSLGGAIAQLNALVSSEDAFPDKITNAGAILFASVGVADVSADLYHRVSSPTPSSTTTGSKIVNLFASGDSVPELDCQFGHQCIFRSHSNALHEDLVYGSGAFGVLSKRMQQQQQSGGGSIECIASEIWNEQHAVCASQQTVAVGWSCNIVLLLLLALWWRFRPTRRADCLCGNQRPASSVVAVPTEANAASEEHPLSLCSGTTCFFAARTKVLMPSVLLASTSIVSAARTIASKGATSLEHDFIHHQLLQPLRSSSVTVAIPIMRHWRQ